MKKPEWLDIGVIFTWMILIVTFPFQLVIYCVLKIMRDKRGFCEVGIYKFWHNCLLMAKSLKMMAEVQKNIKNMKVQ